MESVLLVVTGINHKDPSQLPSLYLKIIGERREQHQQENQVESRFISKGPDPKIYVYMLLLLVIGRNIESFQIAKHRPPPSLLQVHWLFGVVVRLHCCYYNFLY